MWILIRDKEENSIMKIMNHISKYAEPYIKYFCPSSLEEKNLQKALITFNRNCIVKDAIPVFTGASLSSCLTIGIETISKSNTDALMSMIGLMILFMSIIFPTYVIYYFSSELLRNEIKQMPVIPKSVGRMKATVMALPTKNPLLREQNVNNNYDNNKITEEEKEGTMTRGHEPEKEVETEVEEEQRIETMEIFIKMAVETATFIFLRFCLLFIWLTPHGRRAGVGLLWRIGLIAAMAFVIPLVLTFVHLKIQFTKFSPHTKNGCSKAMLFCSENFLMHRAEVCSLGPIVTIMTVIFVSLNANSKVNVAHDDFVEDRNGEHESSDISGFYLFGYASLITYMMTKIEHMGFFDEIHIMGDDTSSLVMQRLDKHIGYSQLEVLKGSKMNDNHVSLKSRRIQADSEPRRTITSGVFYFMGYWVASAWLDFWMNTLDLNINLAPYIFAVFAVNIFPRILVYIQWKVFKKKRNVTLYEAKLGERSRVELNRVNETTDGDRSKLEDKIKNINFRISRIKCQGFVYMLMVGWSFEMCATPAIKFSIKALSDQNVVIATLIIIVVVPFFIICPYLLSKNYYSNKALEKLRDEVFFKLDALIMSETTKTPDEQTEINEASSSA
jgi:hypothetical protein